MKKYVPSVGVEPEVGQGRDYCMEYWILGLWAVTLLFDVLISASSFVTL
jgi:hypothetical protein